MGRVNEDMVFGGSVTCNTLDVQTGSITNAMLATSAEVARSKLAQDTLAAFAIGFMDWRVHDALGTFLPQTAAADDLALDNSTFASEHPHVTAGDLKAAGATTRYARFQVRLPAEYDDDATINIRFHCGMLTTVADNTCTIDLEAYSYDKDTTISADLCATAATDMNSLTFANKDFTITDAGLVSGDQLDCRVAIACNDAATGTVVEPVIGAAFLLCDIRG